MNDKEKSRLEAKQGRLIKKIGDLQIEKQQIQDWHMRKEMEAIILSAMDDIKREASAWFVKYAEAEGITPAAARKRAEKADIEALSRKAKLYVENRQNKDFARSETANAEMKLYNLSMKTSRAELLLRHMELTLRELADDMTEFTGGYIMSGTEAELYRQAGILGQSVLPPSQVRIVAQELAKEPYYGKVFTDTIWQNVDVAKKRLSAGIKKSLTQGKNPRTWMKSLEQVADPAQRFLESKIYQVAVTETAARQEAVVAKAMEEAGFTHYQIVAERDDRTCVICQHYDRYVGVVRDREPGFNAPLFHPHCRCKQFAYIRTEEALEAELDELEAYIKRLEAISTVEEMQQERYDYLPEEWMRDIGQYMAGD